MVVACGGIPIVRLQNSTSPNTLFQHTKTASKPSLHESPRCRLDPKPTSTSHTDPLDLAALLDASHSLVKGYWSIGR
jgi:hypothetical protein